MVGLDVAYIAMYFMAMIATKMRAFLFLIFACLLSDILAGSTLVYFSGRESPEFLYFLGQSMLWLIPAMLMRESLKASVSALIMSAYCWVVSVESFLWQYVSPVETIMHSQYAAIITAIHLFIISTTAKWGGEIGYLAWPYSHRFFARSDL